mgnify:FL=1
MSKNLGPVNHRTVLPEGYVPQDDTLIPMNGEFVPFKEACELGEVTLSITKDRGKFIIEYRCDNLPFVLDC